MFVPTLSTFHDLAERFTDAFALALVDQVRRELEEAYATLGAARSAGVILAMGDDSGPPGENAIEPGADGRRRLVGVEGIAATQGSALAWVSPDVGTVRLGAFADLLVIDGTRWWTLACCAGPNGSDGDPGEGGSQPRPPSGRRHPGGQPGMSLTAAPSLLASVDGGSVRSSELHADGPALLLFVSEECPTCTLTLRRLAPVLLALAAAGSRRGDLRGPARGGRSGRAAGRLRWRGPVRAGAVRGFGGLLVRQPANRGSGRWRRPCRGVAWSAGCRSSGSPLSTSLTHEPPLLKPGCAAENTYDAETLRVLDGAGREELEEMFERGWTYGLPWFRRRPSASSRCSPAMIPTSCWAIWRWPWLA